MYLELMKLIVMGCISVVNVLITISGMLTETIDVVILAQKPLIIVRNVAMGVVMNVKAICSLHLTGQDV